jgi:hypothetical protein
MRVVIASALTAVVVGAGTSIAATKYIDGHTIRPHSLPLNRLVGHLPRGPKGDVEQTMLTSASGALGPSASGSVTARCPKGWKVLGGGFSMNGAEVTESAPIPEIQGWEVMAVDKTGASSFYSAHALCGK